MQYAIKPIYLLDKQAEKKRIERRDCVVRRSFRRHFDISQRDHVPDRKCVLMWNDASRASNNVSIERKGPPKTVRTPENVERLRVSIEPGMGQ
ncbi:hypothetical protein TNCV_4368351 [Trichonephila clavipes]|nr:hypothetical protein TNCV_4368351 [Trichonephila clavipes]